MIVKDLILGVILESDNKFVNSQWIKRPERYKQMRKRQPESEESRPDIQRGRPPKQKEDSE